MSCQTPSPTSQLLIEREGTLKLQRTSDALKETIKLRQATTQTLWEPA